MQVMNWTDIVNGVFELAGAFFILPSILSAMRTKKVASVNWLTIVFFTSWGFWNLYFYPTNGFTLSFIGGLLLSCANITWLTLILKYRKR